MDFKYLSSVLKYVVTTLVSIAFVIFLLYHIVNSFTTEVETTSITYTTQEFAGDYDAYIFRNESLLYTSPGTGNSINHLLEDGEKIAAGQEVCQVYSSTATEEDNYALSEIDAKLERLENSNLKENINYSDTQLIDTTINDTYYTILSRVASGTLGYAMAKSDDLIAALNQRQIITKHVENFDEQITALEEERAMYTKLTEDSVSESIYAPQSGYYYADIDGFETLFSSDKLDNMTLDEYEELISSSSDASLETNSEGGYNCGKIVTDYNWYIACKINTEESRSFTEGYTYTVIFPYNSDVRISMILDRMILQADDDRVVLVFRTNNIPDHFNFLRRQSVQIVTDTYQGYKVPLSAVRIVDGERGVYILEGYVVSFRKIDPITELDGYFICTANDGTSEMSDMLALYDQIIVSGKNLYVGKIIS